MILTAFFRTLGQVGDPRFRSVLLRGIAVAVALLFGFFVLTQGLVAWLTPDTVTLPWVGAVGGLDTVLGIGAFVAMLGLSVILMVPVASAMTSLFIEDVAQAVEDRHYPGLPPTKAVPFGDAIRDSAAFLGQLIAANIVALVLYLLFRQLTAALGMKDIGGHPQTVRPLVSPMAEAAAEKTHGELDDAERGFSFLRDGPLDMRMDTSRGQSAADWLASAEEQDITQVIKEFGEEKFGKRIAHAIVNTRKDTPITRTAQLAKIIDEAVPVKDKFKHPATRAFQGIRIYINAELEQLRVGLKAATQVLAKEGRLAVISFHSLEDRLVKRFIKDQSKGKSVPHNLPITQAEIDADKVLKALGKAIKPSEQEIANNVRSRSSVLRVAEKL